MSEQDPDEFQRYGRIAVRPCGCRIGSDARLVTPCAEAERLWEALRAAPAWSDEETAAREAWGRHCRGQREFWEGRPSAAREAWRRKE